MKMLLNWRTSKMSYFLYIIHKMHVLDIMRKNLIEFEMSIVTKKLFL